MKCLVTIPKNNYGATAYSSEIAQIIEERGYEVDFSGKCLCSESDFSDYSLVVFHPHTANLQGHYLDRPECVDTINELIDENPDKYFLVIAVSNKPRLLNFEPRENLAFLTESGLIHVDETLEDLLS